MTADEVRAAVSCPRCGAPAGERCREGGRLRQANHAQRVGKAEMLEGWRTPGPAAGAARARHRRRWSEPPRRGRS
jgi:hypothetical protein